MTSVVPSKTKTDIHHSITAKIVAAIEAGAGSCTMPWHSGLVAPAFPENAATGKPYRGVNVLGLWVEAHLRRYTSGYWASYRQWQNLGAQVRKGERGALIVFYKTIEPRDEKELKLADEESRPRIVARASRVFNVEQVDGWAPPAPPRRSEIGANEAVQAFLDGLHVEVRHGAQMACYRRDLDRIEMPDPEWFIGTATSSPVEAYHAVLCHETVHWSGAPHRLNRDFGKRFGDKAYAFEELVAELGAAFLCSAFRISNEPRPDHAAYISSWLDVLQRDTRAIFTAASKAQDAVEYLWALASSEEQA